MGVRSVLSRLAPSKLRSNLVGHELVGLLDDALFFKFCGELRINVIGQLAHDQLGNLTLDRFEIGQKFSLELFKIVLDAAAGKEVDLMLLATGVVENAGLVVIKGPVNRIALGASCGQ